MRLPAVLTEVFKKDPFEYFNMNELATDPEMQMIAASIYQLLQVFALGTIVISAIIGAVRWGMTPPAKKQNGIVEIVGWKLIIVMLIAAFVEIVGIVFVIIDRTVASV